MKPLELYRFVEAAAVVGGSDTVFTQARGEFDVVYNSETYVGGYAIERGQAEVKSEMAKQNLDVMMSRHNPVAARYLAAPLDFVVSLTVLVQANGSTNVFWRGRLTNVKAADQKVTLTFESVFTSMQRPGLRARYQRSCRHTLYGRGCLVDRELWAVPVMVTAISGLNVVVTGIEGETAHRFRGGMLKGPGNVVRFVAGSTVGGVTLNRRFEALEEALADAGAPIAATLYPGCTHNMAGCIGFNNLDNYGGFPWIPTKNPMGGSSIV